MTTAASWLHVLIVAAPLIALTAFCVWAERREQ